MALSPWNLAWTLLPVLVFGVLEQDVAASTALRSPALYRAWEFSHHGFLAWVVLGAWHGLVVFVVVVVADCPGRWVHPQPCYIDLPSPANTLSLLLSGTSSQCIPGLCHLFFFMIRQPLKDEKSVFIGVFTSFRPQELCNLTCENGASF